MYIVYQTQRFCEGKQFLFWTFKYCVPSLIHYNWERLTPNYTFSSDICEILRGMMILQKTKNWFFTKLKPSAMEILVVSVVLMAFIFPDMLQTQFHGDEATWISNSDAFGQWLSWDKESELWQIGGYTLGDPSFPKFLIGASRSIAGIPDSTLNNPYDFAFTYEENKAQNNVPAFKLLLAGRLPMTILTVFLSAFLYVVFCQERNRLTAILWIILFLLSHEVQTFLVRAVPEAPMMSTAIVSIYFIYKGLTHFNASENKKWQDKHFRKTILCMVFGGIALGLSFSSKIHHVLILFPFAVIMFIAGFVQREKEKKLSFREKIVPVIVCLVAFALFTGLTFYLLHPILYKEPVRVLYVMAKFRAKTMVSQTSQGTVFDGLSLWQRWSMILDKVLTMLMPIQQIPLIIASAVIGLITIANRFILAIRTKGQFSFSFVLLSMLSIMVAAAFMSPLNWARYFIYPAFVIIVLNAVGIATTLQFVVDTGERLLKEKGK